jgi:hypothetical protein
MNMASNIHIILITAAIFGTVAFYSQAQTNAPNAGTIAYYKQTGIVRNNQKNTGDNTGQFITFTNAGCYDSDRKGNGSNDDFHRYTGLNADKTIHIYEGNSYWGKVHYYFNKDFSRLNVQTVNGVIYVYEKTAAPNGVMTSAYFYQKPEQPRQDTERKDSGTAVWTDPNSNPNYNNWVTPPADNTAELQRLQSRYNDLKRNKEREEQRLRDTYVPVIDEGIARGYFDNRNSIRETIRLYERQMKDIERQARNLGGSVY